jgi:hypothetical protein
MNQFIYFFAFALLTIGCAPIYVPTAHNIPMFSGKGEFQGSAGVGLGINVQAAYAVTKHIGLTANYMYGKYNEENYGRTHQSGEVGLGYYTNFNERTCFEIFMGYGVGRGQAYDSTYLFIFRNFREADGQYRKIYLQPSIGFNRGNFTWAISTKLSYIDFTKANIILDDQQLWDKDTPKIFCSLVGQALSPLWRKKIFLRYQIGLNFPISHEPVVYDYEPVVATVGLLLKLN